MRLYCLFLFLLASTYSTQGFTQRLMLSDCLDSHNVGITALAFSPDGQLLLTADRDKHLHIWAVDQWSILQARTLDAMATVIAFSPDGRFLALGLQNQEIIILEARTLKPLQRLKEHTARLRALTFSSDGRFLASSAFDQDRTVRIWSTEDWALLHTLEGHEQTVAALTFSPDNAYLASAGVDRKVMLWSTKNWQATQTLTLPQNCMDLAFRFEQLVVATHKSDLHVFSPTLAWDSTVWKSQITRNFALAATPSRWVNAGYGGGLEVRNHEGEILQYIDTAHEHHITQLALSPDTKWLISGDIEGCIHLWEFVAEAPPLTMLATTADTTTKPTMRRLALLIGNGGYRALPLLNPEQDVQAFGAALERLGFEVTAQTNLDLRAMKEELNLFGHKIRKLKERGEQVVALVYYSGHGMQYRHQNYLIPVGHHIAGAEDIPYEGMESARILAKLEAVESDINMVILDACRNNPFEEAYGTKYKSLFGGVQRGLAQPTIQPRGTIVAYATAPGQLALDGEGAHSPYMQAILENIETEGLTVEQFFKRVRGRVLGLTHEVQLPWESSSMLGDFYFVAPK